MKIRNGFVSNSSSSSFIILSKNGNLTEEKLVKIFDIKENSPLYNVACKIAKDIIYCSEYMTYEEFLDEYTYSSNTTKQKEKELKQDYPDYYKYYKKALDNNWKLYDGSADDYEYSTIAELDINYEDDDILINMERE